MMLKDCTSLAWRRLLIGLASIALVGCVTSQPVPSEPFKNFQVSISELAVHADDALAVEQRSVFERYVRQWQVDGTIGQLQLLPGQGSFALEPTESPLFQEIQTARSSLSELNSLLQQYANTLLILAGHSEDSPRLDADGLSADLRTNATSVATTLGLENALPNGLFFGFGLLANRYVEGKRQDQLVELIASSQNEISTLSDAGRNLSRLSASGMRAEYANAFSALSQGFQGVTETKRQERIHDILTLNKETVRHLETLEHIHDAYAELPSANKQLQRAVASGESASFAELFASVRAIRKRYKAFTED